MDYLLLEFSRDRDACGTLTLFDDVGRAICGPFPVAGRSSDGLAAINGNPRRDPILRYGDTPTGSYLMRRILKSGKATPFATAQFGPYGVVVLEAISGDAVLAEPNGRFHFLIIGGKASKDGKLRSTAGSLRLSNEHQRSLVAALRKLPNIRCDIVEREAVKTKRAVFVDPFCQEQDPLSLPFAAPLQAAKSIGRDVLRGGAATAMVFGFSVSFVALQTATPARASEPPVIQAPQTIRGPVIFVLPTAIPAPSYTRLAYGTGASTGGDQSEPVYDIDNVSSKNNEIEVTDEMNAKLNSVATDLKAEGQTITVTSSYRDEGAQAEAMIYAFQHGLDPNTYHDKVTANAIKDIIVNDENVKQTPDKIEADVVAKIKSAEQQGIRISWHREGEAVDIRSKGVTPEELARLDNEMRAQGLERHPETGGVPHFHYQPIKKK